jgi:hypothetical protein
MLQTPLSTPQFSSNQPLDHDDVYSGPGFTDPTATHELRADLRTLHALFLADGAWPTKAIGATALAVAVRPGIPLPASVMYDVVGGDADRRGRLRRPLPACGLPAEPAIARVAAAIAHLYIQKSEADGWTATLRQLDACQKVYGFMARGSVEGSVVSGTPPVLEAGDLALGLHGLTALSREVGGYELESMWGSGLSTLMAQHVRESTNPLNGLLSIPRW